MLDGEFTMPDNGLEGKGYQAKLKMTMPGDLFTFDVLGAWMEKEKTAEERKLDQQGKGYNNWLKGGTSDYPMSYAQRQADRATRLAAATAANDEYEIAAIKSEEAGDVYGSKTYTWGYLVVSLASKNGIQHRPSRLMASRAASISIVRTVPEWKPSISKPPRMKTTAKKEYQPMAWWVDC